MAITRRGASVVAFWILFIILSITAALCGLTFELATFEGFVVNALIAIESLAFGMFVATLWEDED